MSNAHLAEAYSIIRRLSYRVKTFRGSGLVKIISVCTAAGDVKASIRLPTVGGSLVVPAVDLQAAVKVSRHGLCGPTPFSLERISIAYYKIRLRTDRLSVDLKSLLAAPPATFPEDVIDRMLAACLQAGSATMDVLDVANDYLSLAADFSRLGNFALAGMAAESTRALLQQHSMPGGTTRRIAALVKTLHNTSS